MLLQMALFHSFLWLSNIPLCIYVPHLFYPFICLWTFRLFPCLGYSADRLEEALTQVPQPSPYLSHLASHLTCLRNLPALHH